MTARREAAVEELTLEAMIEEGYLAVVAGLYPDEAEARTLLLRIGVPLDRVPGRGNLTAHDWWHETARRIANGLIQDGLRALVRVASQDHPYRDDLRESLARYEAPTQAPTQLLELFAEFCAHPTACDLEHRRDHERCELNEVSPATSVLEVVRAVLQTVEAPLPKGWPTLDGAPLPLVSVEVDGEGGAPRRLRANATLAEEGIGPGATLHVLLSGQLRGFLVERVCRHYQGRESWAPGGDATRVGLPPPQFPDGLSNEAALGQLVGQWVGTCSLPQLANLTLLAAFRARDDAGLTEALRALAAYGGLARAAAQAWNLLSGADHEALRDRLTGGQPG